METIIAVEEKQIVSYDTKNNTPTGGQFSAYQALYDYFNSRLFGGELPNCLLNFSRKGKNVGGFFAPDRWAKEDEVIHEISLNPDHWRNDPEHIISILVHEMAHVWQQEFGKVPRGGYHDKQWGDKMEAIGLMPSNTGKEGGKRTGQQMTHYVIAGGLFEKALQQMPDAIKLPLKAMEIPPKSSKSKTKTKYTCPSCETNVWGKDNLKITCSECGDEFEISA